MNNRTLIRSAATGFAVSLFLASGALAQVFWQTTHSTGGGYNSGSCGLESSVLRVSIFPAYLDVEEDVEISALGSVSSGNDAKSLEITGTFSMPVGTAIIGALLWEGDKVLQGKLLDRQTADSLYETVIDRNSTPPVRPRDPLILSLAGNDTYQFKIYPVEIGRSRHLRLRYQLAPVLGTDGLQMPLRAAISPLFPGSSAQISVTFQGGGSVTQAVLAGKAGLKNRMTLPRTRLLAAADLMPGGSYDTNWQWVISPGLLILPVDPLRQVAVKTSFASGQMAGNYLNLYAGVDEAVLSGLHRNVEVVVWWKWQNPDSWLQNTAYGEDFTSGAYQANAQARQLLDMYNNLGGMGSKIGLLHDDSKAAPRSFKASSRNEPAYAAAIQYLQSLQGSYAFDFARANHASNAGGPPGAAKAIAASKARFRSNLTLVKTLYSAETASIRHLIMLTAGTDYATATADMNAAFDSAFSDRPVSVSSLPGTGVSQAGFDYWVSARDHAVKGPTTETAWGPLPGLQRLNLNLVVRNAKKAYDFSIACNGGLNYQCGSLTFHGKSDQVWQDSLEWEAYAGDGKPLASFKTLPTLIENPEDTAIAVLWAGSGAAFSEKKEQPLGPVFGFVDRWASLLSLEKDSLAGVGDSGVPRIANEKLTDVVPNYDGSYKADPGKAPTTSIAAKVGGLSDPSGWRLEAVRGGWLTIRIPGLARGRAVEVELLDLSGKRAGYWTPLSEEGLLNLASGTVRPGVYLLKVRLAGQLSVKRIVL